ncbi:YigZ family protein [Salinibacillus xinjiangensis]|uniref:YigZ family protein n=1 Tax=Salinibacillus xinjiangensis TaxID=1229268 RepID=A0A6G1X1N6_9BACI|nr:YigZ family protein [Salinibacillus xinjiangensis]MRG84795.1 YigZ family protein [Salinibacillus xinjiangensis]
MFNQYFTIKQEGSHEIVIQKSRFIGYVKRTETESEAQEFIQQIKKKHHDATHNCSAYMIGENNQIQKAHDDGEPSGTAGVPMLEVLKKKDLKDTVVVVTRYFGGIKLGAGGLIRAYSKATSEAINHVGVVNRQLVREMKITADYTLLGKLENELRGSSYILKHIDYLENVTLHVYVETEQIEEFTDWIVNLTSNQAEITEGIETYIESDVS